LLLAFSNEARRAAGCSSGGIRLVDELGRLSYETFEGLPPELVESEAELKLDSIQHMCCRVANGLLDPHHPGFTKGGSLYSPRTSRTFRTTTGRDKTLTCGTCGQFGFETVAIIPIRLGHRVLGVLHLGDKRPDLISPQLMEVLERAAIQLGTAIQRARMEEALHASEERYRDLFNLASDAIIIRDLQGNITEANQAASVLTGYSLRELMKMNIFRLLSPLAFQVALEYQKKLLDGDNGTERYELELVRKDGDRAVIETTTRLISRGGQVVGIEAIIRDVSDRKRMETELRESERNFRAIADQSSEGILVQDFRGKYVYANRGATEITGYSSDELLQMNVRQLTHPNEYHKIDERTRRRHEGKPNPRVYESVFVRKDGSKLPVEVIIARTLWYGRPAVIVIFRDILEKKRLRNYVTEVTRAQEEERKRIARELHDETVQSLAVLAMDIQSISKKGNRVPRQVAGDLEELRQRTNAIIDGVRRFSYELRPDVLDQLGLIPALESLTNELSKENIRAHVEVTGRDRRLSPDLELALYRVAQEAIQNVRKHSGATKVIVTAEFEMDTVRLTILDNGRGFDVTEELPELAVRGRLGLIGMEERVRLFGGKLSIKSAPSKGTTIAVEIDG